MLKNFWFIFLFFNISLCFAWGDKGHKIIAQIAKKCLQKKTIDSVQKYLGELSFEDAAVWMDEVKIKPEYFYLKSWHYVNIEKDNTYVEAKIPNVVNEIEKANAILTKKERHDFQKISFTLKILFHLIGDLHQPLHCGYSSDKGGNKTQVQFFNKGSNLHKIWDSAIIEYAKINFKSCLKTFNTLSISEKRKICDNNVKTWMEESRSLLQEVYAFDKNINEVYVQRSKLIIEKQLVNAGVRLALLLEHAFAK